MSLDSRVHESHNEVPTEATKGEGENEIIVEPPEYAISDERIDDCDNFVSNEQFLQTPKFQKFIYQHKENKLRIEGREDISEESLNNLQDSIDEEMKIITPAKGKQILIDAGTITYPGWNMMGALIFDTYTKLVGKENFKLPQNTDILYTRSEYDPVQKALLQWDVYPRGRRPLLIYPDELFSILNIQ